MTQSPPQPLDSSRGVTNACMSHSTSNFTTYLETIDEFSNPESILSEKLHTRVKKHPSKDHYQHIVDDPNKSC
jgi:hypothetical protein